MGGDGDDGGVEVGIGQVEAVIVPLFRQLQPFLFTQVVCRGAGVGFKIGEQEDQPFSGVALVFFLANRNRLVKLDADMGWI